MHGISPQRGVQEASRLDGRATSTGSIGANLASVRNNCENIELLSLIKQKQGLYKPTWIAGSDAPTNGVWFWSDGSNYQYTNWCPNEPNNGRGQQHCLQMSYTSKSELFITDGRIYINPSLQDFKHDPLYVKYPKN
uniref:C-type lectin domain-containing protein n=1 Tax=Oryzias latipes TaxID=8090 RepID=A0A3P9LIN0_ORYLA